MIINFSLINKLKAQLDQVPRALEEAKVTGVLEYRKSEELGCELDVIMQTAVVGGFTKAICQVQKAYPEVEISKLEEPAMFNLDAEAKYDTYFDEFQQGVSLVQKYGGPTPTLVSAIPTTSRDAPVTTPTPDASV